VEEVKTAVDRAPFPHCFEAAAALFGRYCDGRRSCEAYWIRLQH